MREFDLAIIGNGAVANALALQFSERHTTGRVAVVGPQLRPGCASLAAGAMLNVFAELEAGALVNSRLASVEPVRIQQGTYVVQNAVTDRLDDLNFDAIIRYLDEYGERYQHVDPASARLGATASRDALRRLS